VLGTVFGAGLAAIESMRTMSTCDASPVFRKTGRDVSLPPGLLSVQATTLITPMATTETRNIGITVR